MSFPIEIERTFRERWPPALVALAIPARTVRIPLHDVAAIGWNTPEFRAALAGGGGPREFTPAFLSALEEAMEAAPGAVFPRLGYCSWKFSSPCALPHRTARQVLATITRPDARIARALVSAVSSRRSLLLHLVDWRDIDEWSEFRLFIRSRRLAGASQYNCDRAFPEIAAAGPALPAAIRAFAETLIAGLHMDDVIADIYLSSVAGGAMRAEVIELNPLSPRAGACLFHWDGGGDFDGSIRVVEEQRK